jgi:hypothetical protein
LLEFCAKVFILQDEKREESISVENAPFHVKLIDDLLRWHILYLIWVAPVVHRHISSKALYWVWITFRKRLYITKVEFSFLRVGHTFHLILVQQLIFHRSSHDVWLVDERSVIKNEHQSKYGDNSSSEHLSSTQELGTLRFE